MSRRVMPANTALIHGDGWWTLTIDRYVLRVRVCECSLPICWCRRKRAMDQWRGTHHRTHCHSGHAEHMAVLFRRAIR